MFLSLKNEVVSLKRISFDEIYLDEDLLEGMSRPLNKEERKTPEIYFAGNNISSTYLIDLLDVIKDKDVSLNVISKS